MPYIYKITNDINGKIYIGKTNRTPEQRFKEHIRETKRKRAEKRPLYDAINKYGPEHFHLSIVEECSVEQECKREQYWIAYYQSHCNKYGYNATTGGDGKPYLDYKNIVKTYKRVQNIKQTAKECGCCYDSVYDILKMYRIEIKKNGNVAKEISGKPVQQITSSGKILHTFVTLAEAAKYLVNDGQTIYKKDMATREQLRGIAAHISQCARGDRQMAYGFNWRFINEEDKMTNNTIAGKQVILIDEEHVKTLIFSTQTAAARWLRDNRYDVTNTLDTIVEKIKECCDTSRHPYCGFRWQYISS